MSIDDGNRGRDLPDDKPGTGRKGGRTPSGLGNKESSASLLGDRDGGIPDGNVHVNLKQAKNLMKTDMMGKSDPYAVISCGDDRSKTKTVKNNQNPEFNHDAYFPVNDDSKNIKVDLFDADKLGKDKPLGSVVLDVANLANEGPLEDVWLPLNNGKGGQVQLSADFQPTLDDNGGNMGDGQRGDSRLGNRQDSRGVDGRRGKGEGRGDDDGIGNGRDGKDGARGVRDNVNNKPRGGVTVGPSGGDQEGLEPGSLHLEVIQAKDLIKSDLIGKSDPYAVISFDNEAVKTKTVKNNQNPEWNFDVDIPIDGEGPKHVNIDVFDKDKFGKDKPLGSAQIDVADIQNGNVLDKDWIPLSGAKSGQIQVSSDFTPAGDVVIGKGPGLEKVGSERDRERRGERRGAQSPNGDDSDYPGDGRRSGPGSRKTSDELAGRSPGQGGDSTRDGSISGRKSGGGAPALKERLGSKSNISVLGSPGSHGSPRSTSSLGSPGKYDDDLNALVPQGNIHLEVVEAKDLIKADMIGKADPYAVISYGDDKVKTKSIKNNQNPKWNFDTDISTTPGGPNNVKIEVFDKDKFGKDKPLGSADIDIPSLINNGALQDAWIPLDGVKSGQVKVSAGFEPVNGDRSRHGSEGPDGSRGGSVLGPDGSRRGSSIGDNRRRSGSGNGPDGSRRGSSSAVSGGRRDPAGTNRPGGSVSGSSPVEGDEEALGNLHLELLQAKDLVKADMIGKADPYAVVTYGDDKIKTKTVKNNQNPEWNLAMDIPIDPNGPSNLTIEVFDKDKFGKDKPLGAAEIDIPSLMNDASVLREAWIPLDGVKSGQIQLSADFTPQDDLDRVGSPGRGIGPGGEGRRGSRGRNRTRR